MSINCCLTTTTVSTYFESNIAETVTVTDRNWMFHHLKINIRLPPKCRQTLPCCTVTRSPTSRHLQLSVTPGSFPWRLQLHPSSRSSLPCDVPWRHSKGAVTHLQNLLPLLGIPFLYLPPCQWNLVKHAVCSDSLLPDVFCHCHRERWVLNVDFFFKTVT